MIISEVEKVGKNALSRRLMKKYKQSRRNARQILYLQSIEKQ